MMVLIQPLAGQHCVYPVRETTGFPLNGIRTPPSKPLDLPMQVAKQFVKDMRAFHAEPNAIKRDEIAARQLHALRKYQGPRERKLRLSDVTKMFLEMKDRVG